jgi:hypothetical protein
MTTVQARALSRDRYLVTYPSGKSAVGLSFCDLRQLVRLGHTVEILEIPYTEPTTGSRHYVAPQIVQV